MRVLITRYPASEDRLIVRPLLCRRCALRLQPAEPQPYTTCQVDSLFSFFIETIGSHTLPELASACNRVGFEAVLGAAPWRNSAWPGAHGVGAEPA